MKKEKAESNQNGNRRRHGEERLKASESGPIGSKTADGVDAMALVHELQVHQIELEKQNEELKSARREMEDALTKYSDLYDFAPIGLFTIDLHGLIQEVNLAGAKLLAAERRNLINRLFRLFVAPKDRPNFDDFCKSAFETLTKQTCELNLLKDCASAVYVRIEGIVPGDDSPNDRLCRIAVMDITKSKHAEEKLELQSAVLKAVLECSNVPIFSVDRNYCYTSFNSQHAAVMKALFGADIEIGHSILEYHTNVDNRISAKMNIDRTLCGESVTLEAYAGDKALSENYFEISHNPIRDSHGGITGVAVYARDLTEYKRTEKALLKSEKKCQLLIDNTNEPIIVVQDGLLKFVNLATFGMWGAFSERELIDRPFSGFIHPDDRGMVVENYRRRMASEASPPRYAFRLVTSEGIVKWVEINAVFIEWQGKPATLNFLTDITSRKQAEEALRESEEQYRNLFESMDEGFALCEMVYDEAGKAVDFRYLVINPAFAKLTGLPKEQVAGRTVREVIPGIEPFWIENYARVVQSGRSKQFDNYVAEQGKHYEVYAWRSGTGRFAVVFNDITEREQAEEKLRVSRDRFRAIFDRAGMGIVIANEMGFIEDCNAAFSEMLGYDREELLQKHYKDVTFSEDLDRNLDPVRQMIAGQIDKYQMEKRYMGKNGCQIWCNITLSAIRGNNGELIQILAVVDDITERKQVEKALRESEEKWRSLVSTLPDYVLLLDREARVLFLNHCAEGFTEREIIGCSVYKYLSTQSGEILKKEIVECQNTGKIRKFEHTAVGDHGIMRVYESYLVPLLEKDYVTGFLGISRDITGRKRDEEALKRYSENLMELVEERTEQLQQATRLATLGEIATMVGHDLRNPLQVVVSMVYLAKEMLTSAKTPPADGQLSVTEILDDIEKSCSYMNQIISDLQSYAGPLNLELVETDIHQLISNALSFLEIPEGVEVSTELEDGLPEITIDPEKIKRVIVNLVSNSIQSMPLGGQITITAIRKGESVVLIVRDEGAGIPKEDIPKLFLPLFTTKSKGIGLGLTICKRLVEAHRGNIVVTSKVNAGTEVTIEIPQDEKTWTKSLY